MTKETVEAIRSAMKEFLSEEDPMIVDAKDTLMPSRSGWVVTNPQITALLPDKKRSITIYVEGTVEKMNEQIKHPAHYCKGRKYEPKDVIHDWGLNFNLGSAVKYIARCGRKPGNSKKQDLNKAIQYIKFELESMEGDK